MYFKADCLTSNDLFAQKWISQSECIRAKNISILLVRHPDSVHLTQLLLHVYKGSEGVRSSHWGMIQDNSISLPLLSAHLYLSRIWHHQINESTQIKLGINDSRWWSWKLLVGWNVRESQNICIPYTLRH